MIKRAFDIVSSGMALLLFVPLFVPLMILLRVSGEGEVFYRQMRMGRNGKPFGLMKFATMLKHSPTLSGGDITVKNDPRILPLGHFLRRTKINELPQLYNVFVGDMSLIGPRPMTARIHQMFPPEHLEVIYRFRPGLSGAGSLVFRDEEELLEGVADPALVYRQFIIPYKVALESWYVSHQNLWIDIKLILLTVLVVFSHNIQVGCYLPELPKPPATTQFLKSNRFGKMEHDG